MYYIKSDTNPNDCCNCMLSLSRAFYKANCLNNNCPIEELKPKELEWKSNADNNIYYSGNFRIQFRKSEYFCYHNGRIICDETTSLDIAKQNCQEFANKLFNEMIGE